MSIQTGERASGDIARNVTAGGHGGEPDVEERLQNVSQIFDGDPMQLYVLADSDVSRAARVFF